MAGCVEHHSLQHSRHVLTIALAINFTMFLIELWQGLSVNSTSLLADSMDFLSDSFNYLISLWVLAKAITVRAKASIVKASCMLIIALLVLIQGARNVMLGELPEAFTMGWIGLLALAANLFTTMILYKTRHHDSNMESVWLCSRNDALANLFIITAAGLVYMTGTLWPDLVAAAIIAWLGISSALRIIVHAKQELRENT